MSAIFGAGATLGSFPTRQLRAKHRSTNHPGKFPVELPLWCIFLHGGTDLTVLDPFVGTGTTLVAARLAGAKGIGVDVDHTYIETARQRLEQVGEGAVDVILNHDEIKELLKQDPDTEHDGGWQGLLVGLQKRTNKTTGHLTLTAADLEQMQRYAFHYKRGGWQARLLAIFGRTLGPKLDGVV